MPFPQKNIPTIQSEERLVNDKQENNVEKETSDNKTEPVVTPVNNDIDEQLKKIQQEAQNPAENTGKILNFGKTVVPFATPTSPEGRKSGVSIAHNLPRNTDHVVTITDFSENAGKRYNFLIHCETCGYQGRYTNRTLAESVRTSHINAHRPTKSDAA